jgi:hypothetical protein
VMGSEGFERFLGEGCGDGGEVEKGSSGVRTRGLPPDVAG